VAVADESSNGSEPSGKTEAERFEAFAKALVGVPKAEIDKARKKDQVKRRRAKRA
jgi:hypothetical protein